MTSMLKQQRYPHLERAWQERNRDAIQAAKLWRDHGLTPEQWAAIWVDQDGLCCLCKRPLPEGRADVHIDHDHTHCPQAKSCRICRRGLIHGQCNRVIGMARDDVDLLLAIAANFPALFAETRSRIASASVQGELVDLDT